MQNAHIVDRGRTRVLNVLGPTVEFLTEIQESDTLYCVMLGTIPAGVSVPLHSHPDVESFFVLSGTVQVLSHQGDDFKWLKANAADFIQIPGGVKHAFRNTSSEPVQVLITTAPRIGRFFQEVGRPVTAGGPPHPPTPDELDRFARAAAKYHHWLGSPVENAAIGIRL